MPEKIEEVHESKESGLSGLQYSKNSDRDLTPPPKVKKKDRLDEDPRKGDSSPMKVLFTSGNTSYKRSPSSRSIAENISENNTISSYRTGLLNELDDGPKNELPNLK